MVSIAVKNFRLLGAEDRVLCQQADAAEFVGYGEYNVFFLFKPFSGSIMEKVVDKLLEAARKTPVTVIYHNPVYMEMFRQKRKNKCIGTAL